MAAFVFVFIGYVYEDSQALGWVDISFHFLVGNMTIFGPLQGLKPGIFHILSPTLTPFPYSWVEINKNIYLLPLLKSEKR